MEYYKTKPEIKLAIRNIRRQKLKYENKISKKTYNKPMT